MHFNEIMAPTFTLLGEGGLSKILSLFTHPLVTSNLYGFLLTVGNKRRNFNHVLGRSLT